MECSNLNGTCARCASGYGLMEDRKCVRCAAALGEDVENCDGDPGRATSCAWGYSVDARSGTCFKCEVEGCQDCSAPGVCRTCRSGYGFGKGGACVEVSAARARGRHHHVTYSWSLPACRGPASSARCLRQRKRRRHLHVPLLALQCMIAGCTECAEDAEKTCTDCNGGAYALPMPSYGGASVLLANGSTSALSADAAICEPCADPFCSACDVSYMCSYCREDSGRGVELCTGACVPCFDENW